MAATNRSSLCRVRRQAGCTSRPRRTMPAPWTPGGRPRRNLTVVRVTDRCFAPGLRSVPFLSVAQAQSSSEHGSRVSGDASVPSCTCLRSRTGTCAAGVCDRRRFQPVRHDSQRVLNKLVCSAGDGFGPIGSREASRRTYRRKGELVEWRRRRALDRAPALTVAGHLSERGVLPPTTHVRQAQLHERNTLTSHGVATWPSERPRRG
jgi:hypothetical protein